MNIFVQRIELCDIFLIKDREFLRESLDNYLTTIANVVQRTNKFALCLSGFVLFGTAVVPRATCHAKLT